eukprot:g27198.t1
MSKCWCVITFLNRLIRKYLYRAVLPPRYQEHQIEAVELLANSIAVQADELETEAPELFIQNLLQPMDQEEVDRKNETMRKSGRLLDLFMLFPASDE